MKRIFYFWIHLIIVLFIWASPFFIDWKIIFGGVILYYFQLFIFGNCVLNLKQFDTRERKETVYGFILEKLGFKINKKFVANLADYFFPWVILGIAFSRQVLK